MRMLSNNCTRPINPRDLPTAAEAVSLYQQNGGHLTDPYQFGCDPLNGDLSKVRLRQEAFSEKYPSFNEIFSKLVNGDSTCFQTCSEISY